MPKAILLKWIPKGINATDTLVLQYLVRFLSNGPQRIDYRSVARALELTRPCLSKSIDRLTTAGLLVEYDGMLSIGSTVVTVNT